MKNTNFQEDYSAQIPALRTLINAGYTFLSREEAMEQRFGRTGNVLLEPILKEQLAVFNEIRVSSTQTEKFTQSNIDEAVLKLKEIPLEAGYTQATEYIYELLTLGTTLDQTIDGNRREYTLQFIDWKNWDNNVFHLAEEYSVSTTDGKKELRPDIVLFVNGIPFAVIENKREDLKDPIGDAISQHFRNQQEDRIRKLYVYAQILMSCAVGHAKYATNGTPKNFWSTWREKEISEEDMAAVKNKPLPKETVQELIAPRKASSYFSKAQAEQLYKRLTEKYELTKQDVLLYAVGKPQRLLDVVQNFILYDKGVKKIARYQQYFAVKKAMDRIRRFYPPTPALPPEVEGRERGSAGLPPEVEGREGGSAGLPSEGEEGTYLPLEEADKHPSPSGRGVGDEGVNFRGNLKYLGLLKEARELRKNQTPAEEILWQLVRNRKVDDLKFRRQHQIGHYIVDFYCHQKRLIVELDGEVHNTPKQQKHDQKRDRYLKSLGFKILRFPNKKVFNNVEDVLQRIVEFPTIFEGKKNKKENTPPAPSGRGIEGEGHLARQGGVIWHTQGSGKSLTMGFMSEAIAREDSIKNPKILLVTDRTDLDKQITGTFQNIGMEVSNAKTGKHLVEILQSNSDAVVTTIINKFETAVKQLKEPLESPNIFVLIDEGHRTQYGTFNVNMEKALPNACFMAFTGTPLFKKEKNTVSKFGGMIDTYTVREAVEDQAVLPLVYEGRMADQTVNRDALDNYFNMVSEDLSEQEQVDLKKKFSQRSHIADADQTIYATAWDITDHYRRNFQNRTDLKGQVVCSSKNTAVKYYNYLKQIGKVNCALVISPPDDREGEESAYTTTSDAVKKFWKGMMDQYGNTKRYEESIISQFKHDSQPELIIVVDKLLTGFDAPRNTVLYLTRKLRGHTLLQAIARVNRLHKDKDYGYIVDYAGVVSELDDALLTYSDMDDFDEEDLIGTMTHITEEIKKLDPAHQTLLNMFKDIANKDDLEAYQQKLRPDDVRDDFYKRLTQYARILKLALSSLDFHKQTSERKIKTYKDDLKFFMNLRTAVAQRYSDKIDYKEYEGQIQKLMDQHISTKDIKPLTELVNIFDEDAFEEEVEKTIGEAAKADKIASRTAKHITEKMDDDPAFYKKFSQLIQQSIDDFYSQRISELEYLEQMQDYQDKVLIKTDSSIPEKIRDNATVSAYYGTMNSTFKDKGSEVEAHRDLLTDAALKIEEIINNRKKINWQNNTDVTKKMELEIGDYIYDEIREQLDLDLNFTELDKIASQMVSIAKRKK